MLEERRNFQAGSAQAAQENMEGISQQAERALQQAEKKAEAAE